MYNTKNELAQELLRTLEFSPILKEIKGVGDSVYGKLGSGVLVKIKMIDPRTTGCYSAVEIKMLNPMEGEIDKARIDFYSVWGEKSRAGTPQMRIENFQKKWNFPLTGKDYAVLCEAIDTYLKFF